MPRIELDVNPVDFITTDAVGKPGERVFYLQATSRNNIYTLLVEKIQIQSLASGLEEFFADLAKNFPSLPPQADSFIEDQMHIHEPPEPLFRVGDMGIAYDEDADRVILMVREILSREQLPEDVSVIRFWCTRDQMSRLGLWSAELASRGRPICPLCGQPMDPEGHFCPKKNGHSHG